MARPESDFPTVADASACFARLVEMGLGGLAVQVVVVPDSTIQAVANVVGARDADDRPALMIELWPEGGRLPVSIISTARMRGNGMPTTTAQ